MNFNIPVLRTLNLYKYNMGSLRINNDKKKIINFFIIILYPVDIKKARNYG